MHIDPDAFKMMMPEWPDYVARDRDCAGTMCHKESSFMVEVPTSNIRPVGDVQGNKSTHLDVPGS